MENAIDKANFANRLSAVQKLCSDSDSNYPRALLFIPGQDGRYNKGSITLLKYLFKGCVSKELFDETLGSDDEILEDMVILVRQSSLSIVWSHDMKKLLSPVCSSIPNLIEYISSESEENEIDTMQARKCCDFKRMMLESVKEGEGVGIPVPIGYDDIQDIEGWPMIQSFALDQNYCSTGFFTARYTIADITEHLESLFRTVDGYYLENAIYVLNKTIKPHMMQALSMLDASTSEQRSNVTGDDAVGPLEVLFDFGEMETSGVVDPITRPIVLFGADTANFGVSNTPYGNKWKTAQAGNSLHAVMEACEPSTGLRWCRTYFLRRGKAVDLVSDQDALVRSAEEGEEDRHESKSSLDAADTGRKVAIPTEAVNGLKRLEGLYVKLWMSLRGVVKAAFATHTDALEAGTAIQQRLEYLMRKHTPDEVKAHAEEDSLLGYCTAALGDFYLTSQERLQVHLDLMNGVGDIVTIEDVDDMGGSCWVYVRVSVHNITLGSGAANKGAVAVGDTFLFAAHSTASKIDLTHSLDQFTGAKSSPPHVTLLGDAVCITHTLPYYRCLLGGDLEEKASNRLLNCSRSANMMSILGLGKQVDHTGSGSLTLPLLTDHPVVPLVEQAEVRVFSEGFLVEKMDVSSTPLMVSVGTHVERAWFVDSSECMEQVHRTWPHLKQSPLSAEVPAGVLIVFRLKTFEDETTAGDQQFHYNPLERAMPFLPAGAKSGDHTTAPHHIAIFVKAKSRAAAAMTSASAAWRVACRVHDVQEHRGGEVSLPSGILKAFLSAVEAWGYGSGSTNMDRDGGGDLGGVSDVSASSLISVGLTSRQNPTLQWPGLGFLPLRCTHILSESLRLSAFDFESVLYPSTDNQEEEGKASEVTPLLTYKNVQAAKRSLNKRDVVVLLGHAGSGVQVIGSHLATQLKEKLDATQPGVFTALHVDLSQFTPQNNGETHEAQLNLFLDTAVSSIKSSAAGTNGSVTLLTVTLNASSVIRVPQLLTLLAVKLSSKISSVLSTVSPAALQMSGDVDSGYAAKLLNESHYGLGQEQWRSSSLQLLEPTCSDVVVAVDDTSVPSSALGYAGLRTHLSSVNPTASIVRLNPGNLRLSEETVDSLLSQLTSNGRATAAAPPSAREAARILAGHPPEYLAALQSKPRVSVTPAYAPSVVAGGLGLTTFSVSPPPSERWNLTNVVKALKTLFPAAKVHATSVEDTWSVPPPNGETVFARLLSLSRAKVLTLRQGEESVKLYDKLSNAFLSPRPQQHQHVVEGLRSVHGVITLKSGLVVGSTTTAADKGGLQQRAEEVAVVEACAGYIVIRPVSSGVTRSNRLSVQGVLNKDDRDFVEQLFDYCTQQKLPRRDSLKSTDLTIDNLLSVQNNPKYNARALTGNVWFDGHTYLDINGTRNVLRPDLDLLVEEYLQDENKKIEQYNCQLAGY